MLTLDAESQRLVSSVRRAVSSRVLREGRAETWLIFAMAKNNTALEYVEQGFGNAEQLFERLCVMSSRVHVALARLRVGRGLSQYLKLFAVYYDPDAGADDDAKSAGSGPVSSHKVGLKQEVFDTFGPSVIPFCAYGLGDLKVDIFSDKVFKYGRISNDGDDEGNVGGGITASQKSAIFEKFTGGRRRAKPAAPESDGSAAPAAVGAAQNCPLVFEAEPGSGDGDGYGFVPIHMHRPGRIDIANPWSATFFHDVASDHCVFLVDVSMPMLRKVRFHERHDLSPKLKMVLGEITAMTTALQRVNQRALFDVMWFHGSGFGSWQLDPDSWGEATRDFTSLTNFLQLVTSDMELALEASAGEDDTGLIPTFSNQGCIDALNAAIGKRDVASVHLVVDGSHAFDRSLPVAIHSFKAQRGGRCPPVHITAIDPPHLKVRSDVATAGVADVSVPNEVAVRPSLSGSVAAVESSTSSLRQQKQHRMQSNGSCGFLRNVSSLSGGRYLEIGGFVEPTRLEALIEGVKRTLGPWVPKFLRSASQE